MANETPVFVTTCSRYKLSHLPNHDGKWSSRHAADSALLNARQDLFQKFQRSAENDKLKGAVPGPDFQRVSKQMGDYLPAYWRYTRGSFMGSLDFALKEAIDLWFESNRLLFISGLYGLVESHEPIQNYDVDLSGRAIAHWNDRRELLTRCLIKRLPENPIVLNCCGEYRYAQLIDWGLLEEQGIPVRHAVNAVDPHDETGQIRVQAGEFAAAMRESDIAALKAETASSSGIVNIEFIDNAEFNATFAVHPPTSGKTDSGSGLQEPADGDNKHPIFDLSYLEYDGSKEEKAHVFDSLLHWSGMTWRQIKQTSRRGSGTELIPTGQFILKKPLPDAFKDEERLMVTRLDIVNRIAGVRRGDVFHVLLIDRHPY